MRKLVVKADHSIEITGTLEVVTARCGIVAGDDELFEYDGTGAEVFWDEMKVVERNGKLVFLTDDGDEYLEDEIEVIDD